MRTIKYKKYWFFNQPPIETTGSLLDLVLDIPYLMNVHGVIPPIWVINFELKKGGSKGGMSIGTAWEPFEIDKREYDELVKSLLHLNPDEYKKHSLVMFNKIIFDEVLSTVKQDDLPNVVENQAIDLLDTEEQKKFVSWISTVSRKYRTW